jgi:hypothetical protein
VTQYDILVSEVSGYLNFQGASKMPATHLKSSPHRTHEFFQELWMKHRMSGVEYVIAD